MPIDHTKIPLTEVQRLFGCKIFNSANVANLSESQLPGSGCMSGKATELAVVCNRLSLRCFEIGDHLI